jgi:hypothetical protein
MVNTYNLINPHIEGLFDKKIKAKNSKEAATMFYSQLGEHINNSIPSFYFTIQKGSSGAGQYYSFKVKEEKNNNQVNFSLEPTSMKSDELNVFKNKLDNFKLKMKNNLSGGKHKKHKHKKHHKKHDDDNKDDNSSDSSSSSSSDEVYKSTTKYISNLNTPIYYWWYYPYLYQTDSIYIPTFYSYITPYIELSLNI